MNIDPNRISELINRAQDYVNAGEMTEEQYNEFISDIQDAAEVESNDDRGIAESIGEALGSIAGWIIRGGTIVEDFLTGGAGIADDVISFYLASKAPEFGAWVGRKIDNLFSDSGEESMQINANTIVLDENSKQAIESVITKVANAYSIDNVASVTLELTQDNAVVKFKQAGALGSFLGNIAGSLLGSEGIGQFIGDQGQELLSKLMSGEDIDWAQFGSELAGSGIGSYLGRELGDALGMPGIGQYLGSNLGSSFGRWLLSKFQDASSPEEVQRSIQSDMATQQIPEEVLSDEGFQQMMHEMGGQMQGGMNPQMAPQGM